MWVLYVTLGLFVAFIAYILTVAALASKKRTVSDEPRKNVDEETLNVYVDKLSKMLRCKTVYTDEGKYQSEFIKFQEVLK